MNASVPDQTRRFPCPPLLTPSTECTHVRIYLTSLRGSAALPKETSSFSGKRFQQVSAPIPGDGARKGWHENMKYLWRWSKSRSRGQGQPEVEVGMTMMMFKIIIVLNILLCMYVHDLEGVVPIPIPIRSICFFFFLRRRERGKW